jgi:nucleotide-binding universal stress UspA family protein
MPLKSLLAAFSGDPASCSALRLALELQRRHEAHVTGVVWHGPGPVKGRYRSFLTRGVVEMLAEREADAASAIRADFEAQVAAAGDLARADFIDLHASPEFSLPERGRAYDLVVMSRHAAVLGQEHDAAHPEAVALRCGRPVVTAPETYAGGALDAPVLLAWDGKRAAARALGDAIHVLGLTGPVTMLSVADAPPAAPEAGDDIPAYLARHGIAARAMVRPAGRKGIAGTILDACQEVGAGFLVMGAYEHSKLTEDLIGGVTRTILGDASIPVLMSH